MESPAGRLLALLSLLQARPHWGAAELAERLDTTPRTVRRDITRLRDLGYPVLAEPGPHGGYQLGAGGALPPLLLSDDEAVAVSTGLRVAAEGGAAGMEDAAVAALAKLEQVLPARLRERINALSASTVLLGSRRGPVTDAHVLLTVAQACRRLERLRFDYRDGSGRVSRRRVEPYRLVQTPRLRPSGCAGCAVPARRPAIARSAGPGRARSAATGARDARPARCAVSWRSWPKKPPWCRSQTPSSDAADAARMLGGRSANWSSSRGRCRPTIFGAGPGRGAMEATQ